MVTLGARILERLEVIEMSQSELARRVGLAQPTINNIIHRNKTGSVHLPRIARELQTTSEYLLEETDDPDAGALLTPTAEVIAEQLNSVLIPFYDDPYGMGGTFIDLSGTRAELIPLLKDWIRQRAQGRPDQLMLLPGRGDSMQPTIQDGDILLIDRSQVEVRDQDLIWAFDYGEVGMIKRLRRKPRSRGYVVQSDNKVVEPFDAADDEINIVGRVISIMQWK